MRPEAVAQTVLSTTRARAKMHEFRVPPEFYNELRRDPQVLFSLAIGILSDVAAAIADNFTDTESVREDEPLPPTWSEEDGSPEFQVRFSAIFFDAYLEAKLDDTLSDEISILSAGAYYLSDSVGSAAVIVKRMTVPKLEHSNGLGRLLYHILRSEFSPIEGDFVYFTIANDLLKELNDYFNIEVDGAKIPKLIRELRENAYQSGSDSDLIYADLISACCARKVRNSARTMLPLASGLNLEDWAPALVKSHFPIELWPAQRRLCQTGLLAGRSAIIQMPTSAGKTKATELIIRAAFLSHRTALAVIVAPFRALCHDIRGDLSKAFAGEEISLDEVSEAYRFDISLEEILAHNTVLIVTPEKLLFMLRRAPELAARIGLIIYDEGHQFDGLSRGPTYELLLATLRMMLSPDAQVLLISAVIGNAADVASWLLRDGGAVVAGDGLLPTTKSIAFASWEVERGQLKYVQPEDPDEEEFFVPRVISPIPLAKFGSRERNRVFPERGIAESQDIGLFLGLNLVSNGSVALFCGQKASVTKLCRRAIEIFARDVDLRPPREFADDVQITKLGRLIGLHLGENAIFTKAAKLGFFGHHSNTPHGIRLSIEHAMKEGRANFVICTSTLAQGVNFPLRYLIVTTTQQGRERIMVRDFHNLMGRAGRAGMHTEGSVIFSSPKIYDERKRTGRRRWAASKELLDSTKAEPSRSSILSLFSEYSQQTPPITLELQVGWLDLAFAGRQEIENIVNDVVSEYPIVNAAEFRDYVRDRARAVQNIAAYLAEHMNFADDDSIEQIEQLAANTLAYHLADAETRSKLLDVFRMTATALSDKGDEDFRLLIRRSPLPPADLMELKKWFQDNLDALRASNEAGGLMETLYEQLGPRVRSKSVSAINERGVAGDVLRMWIAGQPYTAIHEMLLESDLRIGRDRVTIDHVVNICESGFGFELAMMIASSVDLLATLDEDLSAATNTLHQMVKHGLGNNASIAFVEIGFADRVVAGVLGVEFPGVFDRSSARQVCRAQDVALDRVLEPFPSYFQSIAAEIRMS